MSHRWLADAQCQSEHTTQQREAGAGQEPRLESRRSAAGAAGDWRDCHLRPSPPPAWVCALQHCDGQLCLLEAATQVLTAVSWGVAKGRKQPGLLMPTLPSPYTVSRREVKI